jgi:hypothetical protein
VDYVELLPSEKSDFNCRRYNKVGRCTMHETCDHVLDLAAGQERASAQLLSKNKIVEQKIIVKHRMRTADVQ